MDYSAEYSASAADPELASLKTLPHAVAAERAVLGSLMLASEWDKVADLLEPADFYHRPHQLIFAAMARLIEAGQPLDGVTLSQALEETGELEPVGGVGYIVRLANDTPTAENIRAYAQIVHDRALLRQLIRAAGEITDDSYNPDGQATVDVIAAAEKRILAVADGRAREGGLEHLNGILKKTVDKIDELIKAGGQLSGLSTGFQRLDAMTLGLQPADLIILAARPSMGKTSLAMNMVEHAALHQDKPVVVFSLEMPAESLMMRMVASMARINLKHLNKGDLGDEEHDKLALAVSKLQDRPLFIDDTPGLTPMEMRSRLRRLQREHGNPALVMVDYLQLMQGSANNRENRVAEISEISRALKTLAKEFHCPLMALSQLNRAVDQRPNKRPHMSDLRDSGAIEQDADVIAFIYRDEVYNKEDSKDKGKAEILISKQRNGPIGDFKLAFIGEYTRFDNLADEAYEDY
ncbi:MAG TPA: replicative DNA helicase [Pseudomonadales bacterium]|jgi:replicative DNA helicase